MKLPQTLLTLKLLNGPLLEHKDQQLILSTVNYSNVDTSINQMKNVLKKYFDGQSRLTIYTDYSTIKYRTTLATQNCDVTFRRCDGFSRGSNVNKLKQFYKGNTNHSIKNQYQCKPIQLIQQELQPHAMFVCQLCIFLGILLLPY